MEHRKEELITHANLEWTPTSLQKDLHKSEHQSKVSELKHPLLNKNKSCAYWLTNKDITFIAR